MNIFESWTAVSLAAWSGHAALSAILKTLAFNNGNPKPCGWTETADEILASAGRTCKRISNSGHKQCIDKHGENLPEIWNWKCGRE